MHFFFSTSPMFNTAIGLARMNFRTIPMAFSLAFPRRENPHLHAFIKTIFKANS
ncbi:hypothetical protein LguiA_010598 [Lonicera macranthoides]